MPLGNHEIWKAVPNFSASSPPENTFMARFQKLADETTLTSTRLESISGHRLLVIPFESLQLISEKTEGEVRIEGLTKEQIPVAAKVVLVFTLPNFEMVEELCSLLKVGINEEEPPRWVAVLESLKDHQMLLEQLGVLGAVQSCGKIILPEEPESNIVFDLFQIPTQRDRLRQLAKTGPKIGEGPDNLRKREDWFRGRTDK